MFWISYLLESPPRGDSNRYPQLVILWRNFENYHFNSNPKFPPFLTHLSQRLKGELIVYPCSGVRRRRRCRRRRCCCPPFSKVFSETAWQIKAKFYVEPPWEGRTKGYINGPGHMTKMAALPICGKNLKKSSSLEPEVL